MQMQLPQIYYIIFTAITALGVLLQAFVLLGMYLAIRQSMKKLHEITEELRVNLLPTVSAARRLIEDLSPKLKIASSNLVEVSHTLRHESKHISAALDDVVSKTTAQATRVNEMLSGILDSVEHASTVVQHSVSVPMRHVSGIMAGLKAGFDVLRGKEKTPEAATAHLEEVIVEPVPVPRGD
jgi:methyl-accepting chemotaxis protein